LLTAPVFQLIVPLPDAVNTVDEPLQSNVPLELEMLGADGTEPVVMAITLLIPLVPQLLVS
jgi:hypothetical protein